MSQPGGGAGAGFGAGGGQGLLAALALRSSERAERAGGSSAARGWRREERGGAQKSDPPDPSGDQPCPRLRQPLGPAALLPLAGLRQLLQAARGASRGSFPAIWVRGSRRPPERENWPRSAGPHAASLGFPAPRGRPRVAGRRKGLLRGRERAHVPGRRERCGQRLRQTRPPPGRPRRPLRAGAGQGGRQGTRRRRRIQGAGGGDLGFQRPFGERQPVPRGRNGLLPPDPGARCERDHPGDRPSQRPGSGPAQEDPHLLHRRTAVSAGAGIPALPLCRGQRKDGISQAAQPFGDPGEGVVPEPAHQAEEGPEPRGGEARRPGGPLRGLRHLQPAETAGAGEAPLGAGAPRAAPAGRARSFPGAAQGGGGGGGGEPRGHGRLQPPARLPPAPGPGPGPALLRRAPRGQPPPTALRLRALRAPREERQSAAPPQGARQPVKAGRPRQGQPPAPAPAGNTRHHRPPPAPVCVAVGAGVGVRPLHGNIKTTAPAKAGSLL